MATAMKLAVQAGRLAYRAGRMPRRMYASASSPLAGTLKNNEENLPTRLVSPESESVTPFEVYALPDVGTTSDCGEGR